MYRAPNKIRIESNTNCLAKFIIIDADRLNKHPEEKVNFLKLVDYCTLQNKQGRTPHFLILNNPDFEYVACLHFANYTGQDVSRFLKSTLKIGSIEEFKSDPEVYNCLNSAGRSYDIMLQKIRNKEKFVKNNYSIKKKSFEIAINQTDVSWDLLSHRNINIEEFFDVTAWE